MSQLIDPTFRLSTSAPDSASKPTEGYPADHHGASTASESAVKTFVLDTNVLLHNPRALFLFEENHIVIPFEVIQELDGFKTGNDDIGRAARETIRHLDRFREQGELKDGVVNKETGGVVQVMVDTNGIEVPGLKDKTADNAIIRCAFKLQKAGKRVVFITKDIACRIKADALGINTEDFEAQKVDFDRLYTGYTELDVAKETIDRMFADDDGVELPATLLANQYVALKDVTNPTHTAIGRADAEGRLVKAVRPIRKPLFGVLPRNLQQTMAIDLLLDDSVKLVTLVGGAGTGKTLLALAAGMHKVVNERTYSKLLAARPIMPLGRDIGYLPGSKDEKLNQWMQPIFDNLAYLLSHRLNSSDEKAEKQMVGVEQRINSLVESGTVVLEPLTYIRGRSIPNQYLIIDEAQNLTPHEVKTIVSRVGEGTKIVLTGDATQIDNPYLDASSNGLTYLVERLKGRGLVGHVTLAKSERSELASLVTDVL